MAENRRGGTIFFKVDSVQRDAKGNFTYNAGGPKREAMIGADLIVQGYKEMGQVPFIEGEITDQGDLSLTEFINLENVTATLELANGKVFTLAEAWYAADGNVQTEEGNIQVRFEGRTGEEGTAEGGNAVVDSSDTGVGGAEAPTEGGGGGLGDIIDAVFGGGGDALPVFA